MTMEEKNQLITQYIYNSFLELKQLCPNDKGFFVNEEKYRKSLNIFLNREEDIDELKKQIDIEKNNLLESYRNWEQEEKERYLSQFENKEMENDKLGITLNRQMIELMMIANSNSIEELNRISSELFIDIDSSNFDLAQLREEMFKLYTKDLIDRNSLYNNPNANLNKKISNIIDNAHLTIEQAEQLNSIIKNGIDNKMTSDQIYNAIGSQFPQEISKNIFTALSESRDLSEPGINKYQLSDYQSLYSKLKDFKSITIDYESKYPAVHMENGELYFSKLERCLDFAKGLNKDVRLNALIFFEDCPKELSNLDYNVENKQKVYNELLKYVDGITKMIATYNQKSLKENGYEVVKSVDIFNELITRFSNDFNGQYVNREDVSKNNNLEAGWQKFLSIEDLCSIALVARKNLPNVEFVYNDINLEDKSKLPILKSIIDRIQSFEEKNKDSLNGKKIIDCIGTQMHLSPYITENELDSSLSILSSYGYPIKITEYDQPLSDEYISSHSKTECEQEKQKKQSNLKNYFERVQNKYNIKQLTVWTLTDATSFLLDKKNKELIEQGKKPIESIYAGVFRKNELLSQQTQKETKQEQPRVENQQPVQKPIQIHTATHEQQKVENTQPTQQPLSKNQSLPQEKPKPKIATMLAGVIKDGKTFENVRSLKKNKQKSNANTDTLQRKTLDKNDDKLIKWNNSREKQLYELKTTKNQINYANNLNYQNTNQLQNEKGKVLKKLNTNTTSSGFANIILLSLITGFSAGIIFVMMYLFLRTI